MRGSGVAVVASGMTITDVDKTDNTHPDTVASATVAITAGAFDNNFGTTYETLTSTSGSSFVGSLGTITVSGSGSPSISISGTGTWAEYQDIIKAITYQNTNPNAFHAVRTVTVSVTDSSITETGAGLTTNATTLIDNIWAPIIDTNGGVNGETYTTTYTEGDAPVRISTADATITDEDSFLKQVVVHIDNVQNAGAESLSITGGDGADWHNITGLTAVGSGTSTITLSGAISPSNYQLALRSITYANTSLNPSEVQRVISIVATDIDNHVGNTGYSYIDVFNVPNEPSGADNTLTIAEDNGRTLVAADFGFTDTVDSVANHLAAVKITTLPAHGSLTLNTVAVTAGDEISIADINANKLLFTPAANASGNGYASFTFQVKDDGNLVHGGINLDQTPNTLSFNVTPANDAPIPVDGNPLLTAITEDAASNVGNLISDLVGGTAGGATPGSKSGVTDVDTLNNSGAGNAPETVGQGVAIMATATNGLGAGTWEYSTNNGSSWQAIGAVSDSSALLLLATDKVRFVPDAANATTATLSYYLWDGTASNGTKVNATTRGNATAFSLTSDTASISVSNLNDAPLVDLNGSAGGNNYSTNFLVRGNGVAIADAAMHISDVDVLAGTPPLGDTLASATVAITAGAQDNLFGTIYETLTSGLGTSFSGSLGLLTITGSGTPSIAISGLGTQADYESVIKAITYQNTNQNAYQAVRTVTVNVTDSNVTGVGSALTGTATTSINTIWAPVVDTNGVTAGVIHTATYTEDTAAVKITTADATITDQDSNLNLVVIHISNILNAGMETLSITSGNNVNWSGLGLTVSGSGTDTITLSGNFAPSNYQLALRSISYQNTSQDPDPTQRVITITATDIDGHVGNTGYSYINVVGVNDAPTALSISNTPATLLENVATTSRVEIGTVTITDIDAAHSNNVLSVEGADAANFEIDAGKLYLKAGASVNYEAQASYNITIKTTDGALVYSEPLTIAVTDVNEAVTALSLVSPVAIVENVNTTSRVAIATITVTDPDTPLGFLNNTLTVEGTDAANFEIDGGVLYLKAGVVVDREALAGYAITIKATDAGNGALTFSQAFTLNIIDVNEFATSALTDSDPTADGVTENAPVGTPVGFTAHASDADATTNTITYMLVGAADGTGSYTAGEFAIDSVTGVVTVAGAIDRESGLAPRILYVKATSADGSTSMLTVSIPVSDVNEFAISALTDTDVTPNGVTENAAVGTSVGVTAHASDADATTNTITYTLVGAADGLSSYDAGEFAIDSSTGVVTVAGAIDREVGGATRTLYVQATSADGSSVIQAVVIPVNDVNEFATTALTDSDVTVDGVTENAAVGTSVGFTAHASDADSSLNTITYTLVDAADGTGSYTAGEFAINSSTGEMTVAGAIDREIGGATRTVYVKATSADGSTSMLTVSIPVRDVNEFGVSTPTDTDSSANTVTENAAVGTTVGITVNAIDGDAANNTVVYSLVGAADGTGSYTAGRV